MRKSRVAERTAAYALQTAVEPAFGAPFDLLATAPQGVAKLRQLILRFAIQGKLVPQNSSDESTNDLLRAIRMESHSDDSGARKKAVRAELNAGCIGAFEVPKGWAWSQLGNVVDVVRGITFPASEKTRTPLDGRIACLRTSNVQNTIEWDDLLFVDRRFLSRDEQLVCQLDIIMSMANSRELVGKVALVNDVPWPEATIGGFIAILRPRRLNPRYLMIFLRTDYARSTLIDSSSQTTNIANISLAKLRPLPVPVPPLAEQARIVARVEELMQLCDALGAHGRLQDEQHARLVATLFDALAASTSAEELAENWQRIATHFDLLLDRPEAVDALEQTILQLAVRGLLVPQDPDDEPANELVARICAEKNRLTGAGLSKRTKATPDVSAVEQVFEVPNGWRWARIDDYCEVQGGIQKTPLRRPVKNHFPYLRVANVQRNALDLGTLERYELTDEEVERWRLRPGDLLVVEGNGSETEIGRCSIWRGAVDPCVFQNHLIRVRPVFAAEAVEFLQLFLNSPDGVAEMKRLAITTSGLYNLSVGKIRNLAVPVPPLAEQHRIVARVEQLRHLCADLRERLQQARTTQSRLADAFVSAAAQSPAC